MVMEDILEGLKLAMARGDSLQKAMMSFYNAGYKKEDIEEAARALQMRQTNQFNHTAQHTQHSAKQQKKSLLSGLNPLKRAVNGMPLDRNPPLKQAGGIKKPLSQINTLKPRGVQPANNSKSFKPLKHVIPPQNVSSYGENTIKPQRDIIAIALALILLTLLGVLVGVFFYKEEIMGFVNKFL